MGVLTPRADLLLWSDYTRFVRRHRAGIGACMAIGLLAGLVWAMSQPPTFSATSSISLVQVPVYVALDEVAPPEVSIDTDAQLLHSPQVVQAVSRALGIDGNAVDEHLSVTASPNSHVLHLSVTAESPQLAAEAADAAVTALIGVRREALGSLTEDQLRPLRLLISEQEELMAQEQSRRLVVPSQDDLFARVLQLRAMLQELQEARSEPAEVLSAPVPPTKKDYANTEVPLTSGAMIGLLGGCLLGAARDRRRTPAFQAPNLPEPHRAGDLSEPAIQDKGYSHAV